MDKMAIANTFMILYGFYKGKNKNRAATILDNKYVRQIDSFCAK